MPRTICVVLAIMTSTASAGGVEQQAKPGSARVAVLVLPGSSLGPKELLPIQQVLFSQALRHSGVGLPWQLVAFSPFLAGEKEQEILGKLGRMVKMGKKTYQYMKLPQARNTFQSAGAMLERSPPARCDRRMVADLYFYWARAVLDAGDENTAQKLLWWVGRFDPKAGPDPAVMPPKLVATYDIALDELRKRPKGMVAVEVAPGKGSLFVDCVEKAAPLELLDNVGQEFWLVAETESGTYRSRIAIQEGPPRSLQVFAGRSGDRTRITKHLEKLEKAAVSLGVLQSLANQELDDLAGILGVDVLILAEIGTADRGKLVRLGPYVAGRGVVAKPVEVPLTDQTPDPGRLADAFETLAKSMTSPTLLVALAALDKGSKLSEVDVAAPSPESLEEDRTPWYQTWWFWTAAGAAVLGSVIAGVLAATAGDEASPSGKVLITINPPP